MDADKQRDLEKKGVVFTTVRDFLGLDDDDMDAIDKRLQEKTIEADSKKGCVFTTPTNWLKMGDDEQRHEFETWLRSIGFQGLPRDHDGFFYLTLGPVSVLQGRSANLEWKVNGRVLEQEVTDKWDVLLMLDVLGIEPKG